MNSIETFNAIGMHLTNQSSNANITIHFNGVTTPAFYNSHLNVYGLESKYITLDIPNNLYFDGGSVGMGYAHITNGRLSFLGCFAELKNLTFENSHIRVLGCACKLQNAIFTGSAEYCIVGIDGASIYVQSSIIVNSTASSSVVYGHGADFKLGCILQMTEANKGFEMYNCTILCEENRFDDWNVNDSYFYGTAVLGYAYQMLTSE